MPVRSRRLARRAVAAALVTLLGVGLVSPVDAAPAAPRSAAGDNYVRYVYEGLLFRDVDASSLAYWSGVVDRGRRSDFVNTVVASAEWRTKWVNVVYEELWLGRSADPAGRDYWARRLAEGVRFDSMEIAIGSSDESYALGGGTDRGFVDQVYLSALARTPTELESDQGTIALATMSRAEYVASILRSRAGLADRVAIAYDRTLLRTPDAGGLRYWSDYYLRTGRMSRMLAAQINSDEAFRKAQSPEGAGPRGRIQARR